MEGKYTRKLNKLCSYGECYRDAKEALELVQKNDWEACGTPSKYFILSPRQKIAYGTLLHWFMKAPGLSYSFARFARNGFKPYDEGRIESVILDPIENHLVDFCFEKAYSLDFPLSSALDKIVGGLAGLAFSPIALAAGLIDKPEPRTKNK